MDSVKGLVFGMSLVLLAAACGDGGEARPWDLRGSGDAGESSAEVGVDGSGDVGADAAVEGPEFPRACGDFSRSNDRMAIMGDAVDGEGCVRVGLSTGAAGSSFPDVTVGLGEPWAVTVVSAHSSSCGATSGSSEASGFVTADDASGLVTFTPSDDGESEDGALTADVTLTYEEPPSGLPERLSLSVTEVEIRQDCRRPPLRGNQ